jgi:ABC-type multidrug transport system permease subunit
LDAKAERIFHALQPTSGLDSYMAEAVVLRLQDLAKSGRTVMATIHQPSSRVLALFSHLHLVADGRTVYAGSMLGAVEHFKSIGFPCPPLYNPADWYIHTASIDPSNRDATVQQIEDMVAAFPSSAAGQGMAEAVSAAALSSEHSQGSGSCSDQEDEVQYQTSWILQFRMLYWRSTIMARREPILTKVRIVQAVFVGLLAGLIYLQLGESASSVQSVMGSLFFSVMSQSILGTIGVLQVFPLEIPIFVRENDANLYGPVAYFVSKTFAELPVQLIVPFLFATIMWWMVGYSTAAGIYFTYCLFVIMTSNAAVSLGYALSTISSNVAVVLALGPMLLIPAIIFGGLFINVDEIPPYFYWLSYISFIQYGYKGVSIAVWQARDVIPCDVQLCPYSSGDEVLESLNFNEDTKWLNLLILIILIVGFRSMAVLSLVIRCRKRRKR